MIELDSILTRFKIKKQEKPSDLVRRRTEGVLLTDKLADEIKLMVEQQSGCGFVAIIKVLRLLDSPILKTTEKQTELVKAFKDKFGALTADMLPQQIVHFCQQIELGVKITKFYYRENFSPEAILNSPDLAHIEFPLTSFTSNDQIILEANQVGIIGIQNKDNTEGHYFCTDNSDILIEVNPGGGIRVKSLY